MLRIISIIRTMETLKDKREHGAFDIWYCKSCDLEFERSCYLKSVPLCKKCKTRKIFYRGQTAR